MDEQDRLRNLEAINRLLRGHVREWTAQDGTTYRRVHVDGVEYWERRSSDGAVRRDEITSSLQALFEQIAAAEAPEELNRLYREAGIPLPGDPLAPKRN